MNVTTAVFVLTITFMTVVVPFIVIMHYTTKWKATKGLSDDEHKMLEDLWNESQAMQSRVNALERALRSRNRLLEDVSPDPRWLDAIEHEIAELGIAVAAARAETVRRLMAEISSSRDPASHFPSASLALEGWLERDLEQKPAIEIEDSYRSNLREARVRDRAAGRTLEGPHLSDLAVVHAGKDIEAARASTGERKALLVGVVLSHARLVAAMHGAAPVVLLDDVAAFLDAERRGALFEALLRLGAQIWMTGVDDSAFAALGNSGERFRVRPGRVESAA